MIDANGHWVKFVVPAVPASAEKRHGLDYSLTLHAPDGTHLAGLDNAHQVKGKHRTEHDHKHRLRAVTPYDYRNAAALVGGLLERSRTNHARQRHRAMKTLKVGIASYADMKARTLAIAAGTLKPKSSDPKVWFTSPESFAKVLSNHNRALLGVIAQTQPESLSALAEMTGRTTGKLSGTRHTMERYGLVRLHRGQRGSLRPEVRYGGVQLAMSLA